MRFTLTCGVFLVAGLGSHSLAATTIGSLSTAGASQSAGHTFFGQSFLAPAGEAGLVSASLAAWTNAPRSGTLEVWLYSDDGSNGTLLAPVASSGFSLPAGNEQVVSSTFNATVVPGMKYALLVNWGAPVSTAGGYYQSNYYADGATFFESQSTPVVFPGLDEAFQVNFGAIPEPGAMALGAMSVLALRRRVR